MRDYCPYVGKLYLQVGKLLCVVGLSLPLQPFEGVCAMKRSWLGLFQSAAEAEGSKVAKVDARHSM